MFYRLSSFQARVLCGTVGQVEGFPNYERVSEGHCLSATASLEFGICLSENDVLVRFILSVPEELGDELQSRISEFDGRTQFLTLDHLVAWSQEIQDGLYVPRPSNMFRGGCTPASVCLPKCLYCGSLVNRDSCCQFSRHQNALDSYTGAKGVITLCSSVSKSVRQTTSSAFQVPRSEATETAVKNPLTAASMQQKRGLKVKPVPLVQEEVTETVIFRLGAPQIVETLTSHPHETVGRRVLGMSDIRSTLLFSFYALPDIRG